MCDYMIVAAGVLCDVIVLEFLSILPEGERSSFVDKFKILSIRNILNEVPKF